MLQPFRAHVEYIHERESLTYLHDPKAPLTYIHPRIAANATRNSEYCSRAVCLEQRVVVLVPGPTGRLIAKDVVAPPWATSPPEGTQPDIAVRLERVEHSRDSGLALVVRAARKLADDAELAVALKPLGRAGDTLRADGPGDTGGRGPRAV